MQLISFPTIMWLVCGGDETEVQRFWFLEQSDTWLSHPWILNKSTFTELPTKWNLVVLGRRFHLCWLSLPDVGHLHPQHKALRAESSACCRPLMVGLESGACLIPLGGFRCSCSHSRPVGQAPESWGPVTIRMEKSRWTLFYFTTVYDSQISDSQIPALWSK